jgi:hypothetical protein
MITNRLTRHFATAAATTIAATSAHSAVVHWGNANLVIPATYAGLYINVEARTTGSDKALSGWDINPYGTGSLSWYAPIGGGILHIEDSVGPSNLPLGALVNALGIYEEEPISEFGDALYNWQVNASNYFGFSFAAADGFLHYGWGRMDVGADPSVRTLVEIAYEGSAGEGIAVGAVPTPGAIALLGLAGLVNRRRR